MLAPVDLVLLAAFVLWCAFAGLRNRAAASRGLEDYFLAGRTLPGWKAGISMAATQFAADTPLLVTGLIATAGIFALWRLWIYALAFLLLGFVLAGCWRRAAILTDAELAELRYGSRWAPALRVAKALYFGTVFNCAVLAMVLLAATRIAEPFLPWNEWLPTSVFAVMRHFASWAGVTLTATIGDPELVLTASANNWLSLAAIFAVTALYSATGGLRAVVDTDVAQFAIAMLGTALYAGLVVQEVGGLGALPRQLSALYGADIASGLLAFTPSRASDVGGVAVAVIAVQWIAQMNADGTGYLAQRAMACRSDADARQAALVFAVAQIVLRSLLWIAIGLSLLVLLPPAAGSAVDVARREATFVDGIARFLPAGARGLMLTGMLAALASTLDTHLNWGASYWTHDLYGRVWCRGIRRREPDPRRLVWVARASTLGILGVALAVLTRIGSIQTAWQATLLLGAGMGVPLLLRWLWWRMTAVAELSAIAASLVLAMPLLASFDDEGVRLLVMAATTSAVAIAIARFGPPEPTERVDAFYRRVQPPGFWGPVARRCGRDPRADARRLGAGLLQTVCGALALFGALVGAGTWAFGSPAPSWFPGRATWIAGNLVMALAGVLAWIVSARRRAKERAASAPPQPLPPGRE
jgi:Na+/proline symporter